MKPRKFAILLTATTMIALFAFGFAFAQASREAHRRHRDAHVSALDNAVRLTPAQRREWNRVKRRLARTRRVGIAASADYSTPHPVELPSGYGDAWVVPADDGAVCTFIPDPLGGYGSSCATESDLAYGGAVTMLGGAAGLDGSAIAVMIVPDDTATPTVTTPDGQRHAANVDGIGAELLPAESTLQIGAHSIVVPDAP